MKLRHIQADSIKRLQEDLEKIEASCILHSVMRDGKYWYAFILMQEVGRDNLKIEKVIDKSSIKKARSVSRAD